jgi:hypothetical protein
MTTSTQTARNHSTMSKDKHNPRRDRTTHRCTNSRLVTRALIMTQPESSPSKPILKAAIKEKRTSTREEGPLRTIILIEKGRTTPLKNHSSKTKKLITNLFSSSISIHL